MKLTLLGIFVLPGFLAQATLGGPIVLSTGTAAYTISSDTTGEGLIPTTVSPLASGWLANPISNGVTGANGVWIAPNPSQSTEPNTNERLARGVRDRLGRQVDRRVRSEVAE